MLDDNKCEKRYKFMFNNPIILFIWGIVSKWYIMITIASLVVTFWVFKGLGEAGVLQNATKVVASALLDTKAIAQHCVPKILDLKLFWECVESPPSYKETKEEVMLQQKLEDFLNFEDTRQREVKNPYEE